jgi:phage gp29-like protein
MQRDAQVRACLTTKRFAVLSERAEVHPREDSPLARRAADTVRTQLNAIPGGIGGIVAGALDALAMGYAVGELIWAEEGSLSEVRWHDPRRFGFVLDAHGRLESLELRETGATYPKERFVCYTYQGRYGNPYGESDLVAAYRAWATKDQLRRMWLTALDRFGAPIPVAKVPPHWTPAETEHLSRLLTRVQHESSLVVSREVEIELALDTGRVEPARAFVTAIAYEDTQIARAILGQELTTQAGGASSSGSYALGRVHQSVYEDWIQALREEIAETVLTAQIAQPITANQFGGSVAQAVCPIVRFPNLTEEEQAVRRDLIRELLSGGVVAPTEAWIRTWLGIPEE